MIDKDFDHIFYEEKYPETKEFFKPLSGGMTDRERLWTHYESYGKQLGMQKYGKILYIKPLQGLGNRLLTIDAAYAFALVHNFYRVKVCWHESEGFSDEPFEKLFDEDAIPKLIELISLEEYKEAELSFLKLQNHFKQDAVSLEYEVDDPQNTYDHICNNSFCLESYACINWIFDCKLDYQYDFIKNLKPSIDVDKELIKYNVTPDVVGVHIRRGDAAIGPWEKYYHESPISSFIDIISKEQSNVFLATDCKEVQDRIVSQFHDKVIRTNKDFLPKDLTIYDNKPRQFEAVVEWFLLSKTRKIYGTNWSTFSQTASINGSNQLEIVSKNEIINGHVASCKKDTESFSAVTVVKNRFDILKFSIHSWLQKPQIKEFIIVDWSSSDMNCNYLRNLDSRIKIVRVNGKEFFDCGGAMNVGIDNVGFDNIIKLDVDYVLNPFFGLNEWINVDLNTSFLTGDWEQKSVDNCSGFLEHLNGFIVCRTKHIKDAGLYMSNKDGYGWEDSDLYNRIEKLGIKRVKIKFSPNNFPILHIPHTDYYRCKHYKQKDIKSSLIFNQNKSNNNAQK